MLPPVVYVLALTVGLVSYYMNQRASHRTEYRVQPYLPEPALKFANRPLYQFQNLNHGTSFQDHLSHKTIIDQAMLEGDRRALYDLPTLLLKKANKIKLSKEEKSRLKQYVDVINTHYQPKSHEAISPLKDYVPVEQVGKIPDNTALGMFSTQFQLDGGGSLELYCEGKAKQDLLLLTCGTSLNNDKVFRFIQDTRLQNDAYFRRSDDRSLDERMEQIAANGRAVNAMFYPEYLTVTEENSIPRKKI